MKNKKLLIFISVAVLLLASVGVYLWMKSDTAQKQEVAQNNPQTDNIVTDKDQPLTNGTSSGQDKTITTKPDNQATSDPNAADPEKPTITRAEVSGDYVRVSATFSRPSSGTCRLSLEKKGAASVVKDAQIVVGPSYYTCDGFRIPKSEFSSGQWTGTVTHILSGKSTVSDNITLNVQ